MYKSFTLCIAIAGSCLLPSCDKYLDITPKGYTLLNTVTNYDQWLNAYPLYSISENTHLIYSSDLYDIASPAIPANGTQTKLYTWLPQVSDGSAGLWAAHYQVISSFNSVIVGIDNATGGTAKQIASLKAEAILGRAYEYFYLVNEYGKQYDSASVSTDPGVPIVLSDDVAQQIPPRSTVKQVYDFIISETEKAIPDLPESNSGNTFRGSKGAGYSLLARIYFYARNYSMAKEYAQLAINNSPGRSLIDLNAVTNVGNIPKISVRPDIIYARQNSSTFDPDLGLVRSYDLSDRRLRLFFFNLGNLTFTQRGVVKYHYGGATGNNENNLGTSVSEMMLIIAEAAARKNELTEALEILDQLRKKRIPPANYNPYTSNDQEFVLQKILDERKLELPFTGLRWFDMRRLNFEGRMPTVNRLDATGMPYATLEPGSVRYTFQVPQLVLDFNPNMPQNP